MIILFPRTPGALPWRKCRPRREESVSRGESQPESTLAAGLQCHRRECAVLLDRRDAVLLDR